MNKIILFSLFFLCSWVYSQSDTIRIEKIRSDIYKCQTKTAYSWYIYLSNDKITLVDLKINPNEVGNWFERFYQSQNIYKAEYPNANSKRMYFKKDNDPLDILIFEIEEFSKNRIVLETHPTKEVFVFEYFKI